jgi:hypothetical protein
MNVKKNRMRRGSKLTQPMVDDTVCLEEKEFKQTFSKRDRAIKGFMINLFYPALLAVALFNLANYLLKDFSLIFQYRSLVFILVIAHFCLNYLFLYKNSSYYNVNGAEGWGWLLFVTDIGVIYFFGRLSFDIASHNMVTNNALSSIFALTFVKIYAALLIWELIRDEIRNVSHPNRGKQINRVLKNPYLRHMLAGGILFYLLHNSTIVFTLVFVLFLLHYLSLIVRDLRHKLIIA